jgi:hypothetical protein
VADDESQSECNLSSVPIAVEVQWDGLPGGNRLIEPAGGQIALHANSLVDHPVQVTITPRIDSRG